METCHNHLFLENEKNANIHQSKSLMIGLNNSNHYCPLKTHFLYVQSRNKINADFKVQIGSNRPRICWILGIFVATDGTIATKEHFLLFFKIFFYFFLDFFWFNRYFFRFFAPPSQNSFWRSFAWNIFPPKVGCFRKWVLKLWKNTLKIRKNMGKNIKIFSKISKNLLWSWCQNMLRRKSSTFNKSEVGFIAFTLWNRHQFCLFFIHLGSMFSVYCSDYC